MATSYRSDTTEFLDKLKKENPHIEADQLAGRARLWDRPVDPEWQKQFSDARVAQKPYVYQTD